MTCVLVSDTLLAMSLPTRTIQKLMREAFGGSLPLVFDRADREDVAEQILESLGGIEGVNATNKGYVREEEKPRFVCEFSITDPNAYYYRGTRDTFRLLLDDAGRLAIHQSDSYRHDNRSMVHGLDQIVSFVRRYKQRIDRQTAIKAKRGKVRELQTHAIIAQVRKLARKDRFDFAYEPDDRKLNLFVKLSETNVLVLYIPFNEFKECLPRLGRDIASLRALYQGGLRFQIGGRRVLPRRQPWIKHQSLKET